jgi:Domain of unknown function (DUF397)
VPAENTPGDPTQMIRADPGLGSPGATQASSLTWRSARCSANSCVEIAELRDGGTAVRDGKLRETSPVLMFTSAEWRAFLAGVKAGEFD